MVGLGYIGLPTALLLAQNFEVVGYDIDKKKIEMLNNNIMPFEEPGLTELYNKVKQNFRASTEIEESDVFLIAVPTPLDKELKIADLSAVIDAAKKISRKLKQGNLVIVESTVPPKTCENVVKSLLDSSNKEYHLAYCPERAIPGKTIHEMIHNDRIIGGLDNKSARMAKEIYETFVKGEIHITNLTTAEMVKLMENTFRDVNIALANEFALIAEEVGINVWEAIELANHHPRVNILRPGPGVGGHCLAVDPWFLVELAPASNMIITSRTINDNMSFYIYKQRKKIVKSPSATITIWGVAYKGNVDDTRETPALKLIKILENEGYNVKIHDPHVKNFEYPIQSLEESVTDSSCIIVITDHDYFKNINPKDLKPLMKEHAILDTRNLISQEKWIKHGFKVKMLGAPNKT